MRSLQQHILHEIYEAGIICAQAVVPRPVLPSPTIEAGNNQTIHGALCGPRYLKFLKYAKTLLNVNVKRLAELHASDQKPIIIT